MNKSVYLFFSASVFILLGLVFLLTEFLPQLTQGSRIAIGVLLILWGSFRGYNGWKAFSGNKKKQP